MVISLSRYSIYLNSVFGACYVGNFKKKDRDKLIFKMLRPNAVHNKASLSTSFSPTFISFPITSLLNRTFKDKGSTGNETDSTVAPCRSK